MFFHFDRINFFSLLVRSHVNFQHSFTGVSFTTNFASIGFFLIMYICTSKSFSEALILASTNPQYDNRLFVELRVQYMKIASSEHVVYTNCFLFLCWHSVQFMYTTCTEMVVFMYWTRYSMNNLLSYCGLVDARISASEKDLLVLYDHNFWSLHIVPESRQLIF